MEEKKDSIDKIESQIQELLNAEKDILDPSFPSEEKGSVVPILNEEMGDTKKIENLDDFSDTKEIDSLKDFSDTKNIEIDTDLDNKELEDKSLDDKEELINQDDKREDKKNKSSKKKFFIIFGVIIVLVIVIGIFVILSLKKPKKKTIEEDVLTKSEQKEIINKYGKKLEEVIAFHFKGHNSLLEYDDAIKLVDFDYKVVCLKHEIYEDGKVYLDECSIDDYDEKFSFGKKQEKKEENIVDDSIHVYVNKTNKTTTFNKPSSLNDYLDYSFKIDGVYNNLSFLSDNDGSYVIYNDGNNNVQMINFKTGKKALNPLSYTMILPIKVNGRFDNNFVGVLINNKWGIYNLNNRERVVSHIYDNIVTNDNPLEVTALEYSKILVSQNGKYGVIDYSNGDIIIPIKYTSIKNDGNSLEVIDENGEKHIFDYSGKEKEVLSEKNIVDDKKN